MTIDLRMISGDGNISYQMNFDSVLSASDYGDQMGCEYQVMVSYYDVNVDSDITKVVYQSE